MVARFAGDNDLTPYLPEQTAWHELTNRDNFSGPLKAYYGQSFDFGVQITGSKTVDRIFRIDLEKLAST